MASHMDESMTDEELRQALIQYKIDAGPINKSTRPLYIAKLREKQPPIQTQGMGVAKLPEHEDEKPVPLDLYKCLWNQLNDPYHIASDTVIMFSDGCILYVCRGILASICKGLKVLLYNQEPPYPVQLIASNGLQHIVWVRGNEFISDLKEKISMQDRTILHNQLKLFHNETELQDKATLRSQGIASGSLIRVMVLSLEMVQTRSPFSVQCRMAQPSPSLSITHFKLGMGMEGILPLVPNGLHNPQVPIPPQVQHILCVHDVPSGPFTLMVGFLYNGTLPTVTAPGTEAVVLTMCLSLGKAFNLHPFIIHSSYELRKILKRNSMPQQIQQVKKCAEALGIASLLEETLQNI
ncbi:PREDICTED: uncharacterized protein LOC109585144 [Amphimedon queenslandica]|uniref:Ubiquitin-like domain-containing protein n=1 Tax=Amphimedon queenslandica TaxID=400682 RepID=A0A1X7U1A3_AMPQE|nr:PREDICTED: uncharacterized protein LOC109585144 [Amphimedon queenslandica]|eukprot:XP_019856667.1 PREDICTED: uncharacterized protein LOC109585144 [Amphimedon queenslandica]